MPRVALVHDFLLDLRGAERVFAAICDAWPDADVFTAVYDEQGTEGRFADRATRRPRSCSACARPSRTFRPLLPLYPHAIESLDLRGYDIVDLVLERVGARRARRPRRGARLLLPQPVPLRLDRARGDAARRAARSPRPPLRRAALALAPVGLDRRPAGRPLRRQLARSPPRASAATSGASRRSCTRRWSSRASRPAPVGEHYLVLAELMAHKRIDVAVAGVQRARAAARGGRRRAGAAAAARGSPARPCASPAGSPDERGRRAAALARARWWSRPRRSSGSPRSSRWPPAGR